MKVLVVEDADILRNNLSIALTQFGYLVDSTGDGSLGLSMALSGEYDLVVLDIMLPNVNGFEILQKVRKLQMDTGVLILSAKEDVHDKIKGLDLGADDYLSKPFSLEELEARLRAVLRRRKSFVCDEITIGALSIDLATKNIFVNEKKVELTKSEMILLTDLALNVGKVRTYGLLQTALKTDYELVSQNALEAHISSLRKKLKIHNLVDFVKTKRSIGYIIEHP